MAWTHVREAGTPVANAVSSTTLVFTVGASGCQVGDLLVAIISSDNSGTNGAAPTLSVADTGGNSWTVLNVSLNDPGLVNEGVCTWIAHALVATALASGNTITATFGTAVVAKSMSIREFAGGAQTTTGANRLAGQNGTTGTSTTPSAALNPATLTDYLMIGAVGAECGTADTFTQDTDTTNGSWVGYTRVGAGTTTSGNTVAGAYKTVTANGSQTYNPTLGTSRDWAEKMAAFRAAIDLAGSSAGTSTATGTLTVSADVALAGSSAGTSTQTSAVTVDRGLAASSAGTSSQTSAVTVDRGLNASSAGVSTATGSLVAAIPLAGLTAGVSSAVGSLTVAGVQQLEALSAGSSSAVATLSTETPLKAGYFAILDPRRTMWGDRKSKKGVIVVRSPGS